MSEITRLQADEMMSDKLAKFSTEKVEEKLIELYEIQTKIINDVKTENFQDKVKRHDEIRSYLSLWIFFDFFIVHKHETYHYLKLKDYFYKYIFEIDLNNFELYKRKNLRDYSKENFIPNQLKRIELCFKICDFKELSQIFTSLGEEVRRRDLEFKDVQYDFERIFEYMSTFFYSYDDIINNGRSSIADRDTIRKNCESLR